ncbi:MAG: DUF86 domain-containing protein [Prevotellaceae bacterium]|jgi:uncharacterized protein with HEPN domain|nr:DUF86 domain-containing protein [Prevotellaceae bacterium]
MDDMINTWLFDILQAINEIESFFCDKPKVFSEYKKDIQKKRAVERDIAIIGEAVNRILKENPSFQIQNARQIIDTRNRVIHAYDAVTDEIIWSIVIKYLPELKKEINTLLK